MSDAANKDDEKKKVEDPEAAGAAGSGTDGDEAPSDAHWRDKARLWERRAKENADAAKKLAEIEDKDKSETERLTERTKKAEQDAKDAKLELARTRVAMRKGLTESQAKRLIGTTEEEFETDADELIASFNAKKDEGDAGGEAKTDEKTADAKPGGRPKEAMKSGATPAAEPDETDPAKLAASLPRL